MRRTIPALLLLVVALALPALASNEVVRLRDGSSLRGRLLAVEGDSLTFRLSVGPRVKIHRSQILSIVFDDTLAVPGAPVTAPLGPPETASGKGTIAVSFKNGKVSSKIAVKYKKDWEAHESSNAIVVELLLDGTVFYSAIDSTTDKKIYKGHITELKNDAILDDFTVEVPAGRYQCEVIVRNLDVETFREDFIPEPLHAALVLDDFEVPAGRGTRIETVIDKGLLRLGKAQLRLGE